MALTQRLEFRQSQSLVMTPQLMQAIKLLQLSNLDLSAFVEEELERNPLLERASDGPELPVAGEVGPERAEFAGDEEGGSLNGEEFSAGQAEAENSSPLKLLPSSSPENSARSGPTSPATGSSGPSLARSS
ncbi:MAG: hypothetical protein ACREFB_12475, partial [Stellaceae bacterium]